MAATMTQKGKQYRLISTGLSIAYFGLAVLFGLMLDRHFGWTFLFLILRLGPERNWVVVLWLTMFLVLSAVFGFLFAWLAARTLRLATKEGTAHAEADLWTSWLVFGTAFLLPSQFFGVFIKGFLTTFPYLIHR